MSRKFDIEMFRLVFEKDLVKKGYSQSVIVAVSLAVNNCRGKYLQLDKIIAQVQDQGAERLSDLPDDIDGSKLLAKLRKDLGG